MDVRVRNSFLKGPIRVPGSKSHTIRAVIFAAMAEGVCEITNPLTGEDCRSAIGAVGLMGAQAECEGELWRIRGAGEKLHLPSDVVHVGNSGSVLYFLSPIAACFDGWSVFTGDESIRSRPVAHLADALGQAGAQVHISRPGSSAPPVLIRGPIKASHIRTDGRLSQYISGFMMAAPLLDGTTDIELTDPKETAYLVMTKNWLEKLGVPVTAGKDMKHIRVQGPKRIQAFNTAIPSDWEAAAFPLTAVCIGSGEVSIEHIDTSGSQCDALIVPLLRSLGADIRLDRGTHALHIKGGARLSVEHFASFCANETEEDRRGIGFSLCDYARMDDTDADSADAAGTLRINCSSFPDAVCALAVAACFTEGTIVLEDIGVCRSKETDRIRVMAEQLSSLGADIREGKDFLTIRGHSPITKDGLPNGAFTLHGGTVESKKDHRVAMSLMCLGLALKKSQELTIKDAECCSVSFPGFIEKMRSLGAFIS